MRANQIKEEKQRHSRVADKRFGDTIKNEKKMGSKIKEQASGGQRKNGQKTKNNQT